MVSEPRLIELSYRLTPRADAWVLPEVPVPESHAHDLLVTYLVALLTAWVEREKRDALVVRNLALRWMEEHPRVGLDPDVALIEPAPPDARKLKSLCTWKPGHAVPSLAIEVVSESHPYEDYMDIQERYADCGVSELWVIDAELSGPARFGGPHLLQVWRIDEHGSFTRVYAGDAYRSPTIDACVRVTPQGVVLSDDAAGSRRWLSPEESQRAERDARLAEREARLEAQAAEREGREAERQAHAAQADLERRVRQLEEQLTRKP